MNSSINGASVSKRRITLTFAGATAALIAGQSASAAPFAWNVTSGNWYDATNWSPNSAYPGTNDDVTFSSPAVNGTATTVYHNAVAALGVAGGTVTSMTFSNPAGTTIVGGTAATPVNDFIRVKDPGLTFTSTSGPVVFGTASGAGALSFQLFQGNQLWTNDSASAVTFNQGVSGPGGLGRKLTLDGSGLLGNIAGGVSDGGSGTVALIKNGPGTWQTGAISATGGTTVNAGTLFIRSQTFSGGLLTLNGGTLAAAFQARTFAGSTAIGGDVTIGATGGFQTNFSGPIDLGTAIRQVTIGNGGSNWSGVVSGGGGLSKLGTNTLTLSGVNTYTGPTSVSAGALRAGATTGSALGATSGVTVNAGGTLTLLTANQVNDAAPVTFNGGTFDSGGFAETLGVASVTGGATSIIDMGTTGANTVTFAASAAASWTGMTLDIYNWTGTVDAGGGTDKLFFGNSGAGLGASQLAKIRFFSTAGTTQVGVGSAILSTGEVIASSVPEPTCLGLAAITGGILAGRRRRVAC